MKILDTVWMLVKNKAVIYTIGTSAQDVWKRVIESEVMGTGVTEEVLRKRGWRAKKVSICK
jgi:hypothetical protein